MAINNVSVKYNGGLLPDIILELFQHAHFIPIMGVGKRGGYQVVHGDLPRQHPFGTTLRFTGPVPADSRQLTPSVRNCVTR